MAKCSICKKEFTEYGNNAYPVNRGRCCDDCNLNVVIPARIINAQKAKEENFNGYKTK